MSSDLSSNSFAFHQYILSQELTQRIAKNSGYSMRSLAKSLRVDPGVLSRILSGERRLSLPVAQRICAGLGLSPIDRERFLDSAVRVRRQGKSNERQGASSKQLEIDADRFHIIADWYHYAILELTFVKGFQSDPKWIAKALGISLVQAKLAIARLLRLELLIEVNGGLTKATRNITTANKDITTPALKHHQLQILENAIKSLNNDPISERSMTGMTMAIDPSKMDQAKAYIEEFSQKMCELLETGNRTSVYQLGISLYPLQRSQKV